MATKTKSDVAVGTTVQLTPEQLSEAIATAVRDALAGRRKRSAPKGPPPMTVPSADRLRTTVRVPKVADLDGMDPLQRMQVVIDAAEAVGFIPDVVGQIERGCQRVIERHTGGRCLRGMFVPKAAVVAFAAKGIDLATFADAAALTQGIADLQLPADDDADLAADG